MHACMQACTYVVYSIITFCSSYPCPLISKLLAIPNNT
jgi:hypothetical protein